ncbi:MAG TPA: hypothetical protein VLZ81_18165 [Blastocatellia bacterium]|nr:hypothetical protein [Blastocatellia bacterium]
MNTETLHLTEETVRRFRARGLSPLELAAAHDHADGCEYCHGWLFGGTRFKAALSSANRAVGEARSEPHLSFEQMADYVDSQFERHDIETIEIHISVCEQCRDEVSELASLRDTITIGHAPSVKEETESLSRNRPLGWFSWRVGLAAAALALCFLVLLVIALRYRSRVGGLESRLAGIEKANAELSAKVESDRAMAKRLATLEHEAQQSEQPGQSDTGETGKLLVAVVNDGSGQIGVNQQGGITGLSGLSSSDQEAIKLAFAKGQVRRSADLAAVNPGQGALLGPNENTEPGKRALIGPVATLVQEDRPKFSWRSVAGASQYVVEVYDTNMTPVTSSPPLNTLEWRPSAALKRGVVFVWQVRSNVDGAEVLMPRPSEPEARFKIIESSKMMHLKQELDAHQDSHLFAGLIFARYGLMVDARREFQVLARMNPDSSVARKLAQDVRAVGSRDQ